MRDMRDLESNEYKICITAFQFAGIYKIFKCKTFGKYPNLFNMRDRRVFCANEYGAGCGIFKLKLHIWTRLQAIYLGNAG